MGNWSIEGYFGSGKVLKQVPIVNFPFRIGREQNLDLSLDSDDVSRIHAEITEDGHGLIVSDLDSTNGTFVNRKQVSNSSRLNQGDVLHIGPIDFRIIFIPTIDASTRSITSIFSGMLPERVPVGSEHLRSLLDTQAVEAVFQAINNSNDGSVHAYEILGRGTLADLPNSPLKLFALAESIGLEVELSELLRDVGVATAHKIASDQIMTVNTHPAELNNPTRLVESLLNLRKKFPDMSLVLEIHEQAITDIAVMRDFCAELKKMEYGLAYDDFGAGQARLLELVEAPADYLKFDIALIRDLDKAGKAKKELVRMLIEIANSMGSKTLAEGVSHEGERDACIDLGFDYMQGFFYHKPSKTI